MKTLVRVDREGDFWIRVTSPKPDGRGADDQCRFLAIEVPDVIMMLARLLLPPSHRLPYQLRAMLRNALTREERKAS